MRMQFGFAKTTCICRSADKKNMYIRTQPSKFQFAVAFMLCEIPAVFSVVFTMCPGLTSRLVHSTRQHSIWLRKVRQLSAFSTGLATRWETAFGLVTNPPEGRFGMLNYLHKNQPQIVRLGFS